MSEELRWDTSLQLECQIKVSQTEIFYPQMISSQTGPQGPQVRERVQVEGDERRGQDDHRQHQRCGDDNLQDQLSIDYKSAKPPTRMTPGIERDANNVWKE